MYQGIYPISLTKMRRNDKMKGEVKFTFSDVLFIIGCIGSLIAMAICMMIFLVVLIG